MLKRITFIIIIKVVFSLFSFQLSSQTILIDPNFEGGFGMGSTFTENGWTVVNGNVANKWILDTVPGTTNFASNAAYISDNISGSTWNYLNSSTSVVHFIEILLFQLEK
ncbi:MAG: hypothetical protein IPN46_20115 [Saprospiraceae bacterium]|nr:hypothetical protein [Saprospiraceae bacterium]